MKNIRCQLKKGNFCVIYLSKIIFDHRRSYFNNQIVQMNYEPVNKDFFQ